MVATIMPPRKSKNGPTDDRSNRKTAPIQVEKELAVMVVQIAAHDGKTIAETISPLIRQWVLTNYERVLAEGKNRLDAARAEGKKG